MADFWTGVDGCRGGWVVAVLDSAGTVASLEVRKSFAEVAVATEGAAVTLVDMPIGLPSAARPQDRWCDKVARELLGPRASSIFPVPARESVWTNGYAEASETNHQILGWKLSRQSWGICPKIREVDAVFRIALDLQQRIRETHPELCFRLLNNQRPIENPKKSRAGLRIRRELLRSHAVNLDSALRRCRGARPDDLLDAVAAAVVARLFTEGRASSLHPVTEQRDAFGLVMEIVGA